MPKTNHQTILNQARTMANYEKISHLRQANDYDQLLDLSPDTVRHILDLGCGTGALLARAIKKFPSLSCAVGIDRMESRLDETKTTLKNERVDPILYQANLTDLPILNQSFDLITMTSVLHWLHPDEELVFQKVLALLSNEGVFLCNSYHPIPDAYNAGGTDLLVYEAFSLLGVDREATRALFKSNQMFSIAERTLPVPVLEKKLSKFFHIDNRVHKYAEMHVSDGLEYQAYHAATFGTYYSSLLEPEKEEDFFDALGQVAEKRMNTYGVVTFIPVCLWRCSKKS